MTPDDLRRAVPAPWDDPPPGGSTVLPPPGAYDDTLPVQRAAPEALRLVHVGVLYPHRQLRDVTAAVPAAAGVLRRWGQRTYPVVTPDHAVLAGWEWVLAADQLGWTSLWVMMHDDDQVHADGYVVAAHRVADRTHWHHAQLLETLDGLPADVRRDAGYSDDAVRDLRRHVQPVPLDEVLMARAEPTLELGWAPLPVVPARAATHSIVPAPLPAGTTTFDTLLSYWYYRDTDLVQLRAQLGGARLFIDCGAYSAKTQGAAIDLAEYAAWLGRHAHLFECFVNLDVIGDAEATCRNQHAIEELGVDAMPVFHGGEDMRYLEAYCEQYPYVALGGMVGFQGDGLMRWLAQCFEVAARYGTVFHGFGQTRTDVLAEFPWYSVDSSSWGGGHRFGRVDLWDHRSATFVGVEVGNPRSVYEHAELVREHGVDPDCLADREQYHARHAIFCAATAWRRYADFLRQRHGPVHVRDESRAPGLHLYLVDGSIQNLTFAAQHTTNGEDTPT